MKRVHSSIDGDPLPIGLLESGSASPHAAMSAFCSGARQASTSARRPPHAFLLTLSKHPARRRPRPLPARPEEPWVDG